MIASLRSFKNSTRDWPLAGRFALQVATALLVWALLANTLEVGAPPGYILRGFVVGSLYALSAIGIVLVFRANRVINFAQAELGSVAAVIAIELVVQSRVNYFVAIGLGLVVAALLGALVDMLIIRRFRKAPRLILTVATIGIAQVLAGVALIIPLVWEGAQAGRFITPFTASFTVSDIRFDANNIVVLIVAPLAMFGLATLLRRSDYGIGVRAAAENEDRASLLGIPVRKLSTMVWALASMLSATAVLLRVPLVGFASFQGVSGASNGLLLRILAAAVIGRMENLPRTVIAAISIGIFDELASAEYSNTNYVDAVLVVVILLALLTQRDAFARSAETGISSFRAVREVRPIPDELRRLPEIVWGSRVLRTGLLAFAVSIPLWMSGSQQQASSYILIYAIVALSLLVLTGWSGQISLGQFALVGFGGATTSVLYGRHGWDFLLAMPAGIAVAAGVAVIIGLPALRIRGPFLAVTTLAFAVTASTFLLEDQYLPWFIESRISPPVLWGRIDLGTKWVFYEVCLAALLLTIAAVRNVRSARPGRAVISVRDNEPAAQSVTIAPTRTKLMAFALSGGIAGFAGSLYVVISQGLNTDAFDVEKSIRLFSMVVIGGLGSVPGAVLGALYVRSAEFFLAEQYALIASGAGILVLLLFLPEGLGGGVYRIRDMLLRAVASRRGLIVPSLLADRRTYDMADDEQHEPASRPEAVVTAATTDRPALLRARGVDVAYGQTQVLFGVDLDVYEGEIVALLGTNGAGKSTILRAISGLASPGAGTITFGGRDITFADPNTTARMGITQVPGGRGVFPTLSVGENLRVAGWLYRKDQAHLSAATERVLEYFPVLRERWDTPAGNLSGGEQQMLSLGQAFLAQPKLLMIDELSLGLAPAIVDQLLEIVHAIHASGTTILVVEQSVNTALRLAERAVFLEKGEVRFSGPTAELIERSDILRAVYLRGAASMDTPKRNKVKASVRKTATTRNGTRAVVLEAEGVYKSYGGVTAVDEVSLSLYDGEVLGVVGPNGAGKTTLFDILSGFTTIERGRVSLLGEDVTDLPAHIRAERGLGRSFQDARLWSSLTVLEAIAVGAERTVTAGDTVSALLGMPAVRDSERRVANRVGELIEMFELGAFRDKFISELSTGSRRMVEIACLIANEPKILLLDEPSSGIAQREAEALGPVLKRVQEHLGASILIIEHDMPLLTGISDRLIALDLGRFVTTGSSDEVLTHPQVVSSYLGEREVVAT